VLLRNRSKTGVLPGTVAAIEAGMAQGLHPGAQLYVSVDGRAVADLALGEALPGVPMRTDTILPLFCAGKPVTALAIGALSDAGLVDFDAPVARYIPEFATAGKEGVTLAHLLTHTAGWSVDVLAGVAYANWPAQVSAACGMVHEPELTGTVAYSVWTSWFILGEIVQRVQPLSFDDFVQEAVLRPAGVRDVWFTIPVTAFDRLSPRLGTVYEMAAAKVRPNRFLASSAACGRCVPSIGARGPLRSLARLYEHLLFVGRERRPVVAPTTVARLTARHRTGLADPVTTEGIDDVAVPWGLGFAVETDPDEQRWRAFSSFSSPQSFGHGGLRSSVAFADPAHGLVVALATNGMPEGPVHRERQRAILDALYRDLGLAA